MKTSSTEVVREMYEKTADSYSEMMDAEIDLSTWEGSGVIDYGGESDVVAFRYGSDELNLWVQEAGFSVTRCVVEPVEEIPMEAIYLEAVKEQKD